uniref:CSON004383 protein n=1 Tax=Culicoides sonorensis TaxID=179676 RepID=A0A336MPQ4_CULSO
MSNKLSLKVLVLGDVAVGKSSLANRYVNQTFSFEYKVTIGADFFLKQLQIGDNSITLQIWDTAGQERYDSFNRPFYRGADCALIVYDITDPRTFANLDKWFENLIENVQNTHSIDRRNIPIAIVGNRLDLHKLREVEYSKAELWCKRKQINYFEVSAKTGENVDTVFDYLVEECLSLDRQLNKIPDFNIRYDNAVKLGKKRKLTSTCC